ncbi:hypothetical protein HYY75_09605 [bacterium]|nr:hypothetical protein [bacterium]
MVRIGKFHGLFGILAVSLICCTFTSWAYGETISQSFEHKLGFGESSKSWEHRVDLPDGWAMKNLFFAKRTLALSGKLVIEREEFKPNYYYVKVRLPKATLWTGKGSLAVTLEGASQPLPGDAPDSPTGLWVNGGSSIPNFKWNGLGKYTAITLLDRGNGKTVWERLILNSTKCQMDEGDLRVGHHYLWAVKQSDETARYSTESQAGFRIDTKWGPCEYCHGMGSTVCTTCSGSGWIWVGGGPNGTPIHTPCHRCNGTGRERCTWCHGQGTVQVPVIVVE